MSEPAKTTDPPALKISTNAPPARKKSPSPTRPPVSPITPPLNPTNPEPNRQTFTHSSQADQIGIPAPPPEPIDFESNPDAIALKSAISVLQIQRKKASEDMQKLTRTMEEALGDPEGFVKDLASGKVKHAQGGITLAPDDDDDEDEEGAEAGVRGSGSGQPAGGVNQQQQQRSWQALPVAQDVVRTPPINWSKYAVVGESLDKLHREQVSKPAQTAPATYKAASGVYEFKGSIDGKQEPYRGVMAPYSPDKDVIDKQPKGKK